ncbi:MAG: hypothetical protein ACUVRM_00880 [Bacillota bacterium]
MKKVLLSLAVQFVFLFVGTQATFAETTWYPNSSTLGLDARSLGMGGACLAIIDPYLSPANPAVLPFLDRQAVSAGRFVHPLVANLLGDQTYLHLDYLHPNTENGAYSLMAYQNRYFISYEIADTSIEHYYTDLKVLQYGYGYRFNDYLSLGFNLRYINQTDNTAEGDFFNNYLSLDGGAIFRLNEAVTAAILVMDFPAPKIQATFNSELFYYVIEPRILFGGSVRFGNLLLVAIDVEAGFRNVDELLAATRLGLELRPFPFLALRAGAYHGQKTMGFGLKLGRREGMEINLDFGQYWPESGNYASPTQSMQMTVYF